MLPFVVGLPAYAEALELLAKLRIGCQTTFLLASIAGSGSAQLVWRRGSWTLPFIVGRLASSPPFWVVGIYCWPRRRNAEVNHELLPIAGSIYS
jgi:hypothetical protein